jgi:hypothetical protein
VGVEARGAVEGESRAGRQVPAEPQAVAVGVEAWAAAEEEGRAGPRAVAKEESWGALAAA